MKPRWYAFPVAFLPILAFTACSNSNRGAMAGGGHPIGTGPFDARGNYVEAWADSPSQWRKGQTQVADVAPDRPAADVPVSASAPVIAANTPRPSAGTTTTVVYRKPTPPPSRPAPAAVKTTVKPKPTAVAAKPKPKPKPVVVKPKSTRHTVKAGDNLYNIAKRYGTSVGAIQSANSIKGSMIRPGQSLVIPR